MNRARRYAIGCPLLPVIALAGGGFWVASQLRPVSTLHRNVKVTIRQGMGAARVAKELKSARLIRNERIFLWYARQRGDLSKLKAGEYRLSPDMTPSQILDQLNRGGSSTDEIAVTIPEGYTVAQISAVLKEKGVIRDSKVFRTVVLSKSPPVEAPFVLPSRGLEGFLYPDTYRFRPNSSPASIAQTMVNEFNSQFYQSHSKEIRLSGHTLPEIVTIASLIEREAEVPQDRSKIAGVIENRLKKGMRLQIDASIDYALGRHLSHVYNKHLQVDSPYNTYRFKGLPPGPIANPGKACLEAALSPEKHNYLFYVASPDGSHVFTTTESEHLKAVARMKELRSGQTAGRNG